MLIIKKIRYTRIFLKNGLIDFSAVDSRSNSPPKIFHFRVILSIRTAHSAKK